MYFGGDYNPEQWPEEVWLEDMRLMRESGVNLVSLGIFAWGLLEPAEGRYDFGWLDRVMDLLHDNGIQVDLATPTSSPPSWFRRSHPASRLVGQDGQVVSGGSRHGFCPSSPEYARAAARITEQLAQRYAGHPAVAMWHVHNEYGWANASCYCDASQEHFRRWLRDRYGTLEALNAAWGTLFWGLTYRAWDEIEVPRNPPPGLIPALELDFRRFSVDAHIALFRAERDIIKRHSAKPVTTNFMIANCKPMDYWKWAAEVDVVSNDHYLQAENPGNHIELAMCADLTRSVAGGRPWLLMEHSTGAVNWQPRNLAKRPGEMRRNSLAHVARGSDSVLFFQWRASRFGAEKFHSAMVPHAGTDSGLWREVVALGQEVARLAVEGRVEAEVAIVWDWESWWALELPWRPSSELEFRERIETYYAAMWREHVTVDFVHPSHDLSRYKLVVAPSSYALSQEAGKNLQRYVESGGHLLVSFFSGIVDGNDTVHPGSHPGALREVLGLSVEEFHPLGAHAEISLDGGQPATMWSERVRLAGALAVRAFASGPDAGHPALTRHDLGRGSAWYVATAPADVRPLLRDLLDHAGVERPRGLPDDLEVVRRGRHTFLINHGDSPVTAASVTVPAGGVDILLEE
ncbi:beta-galactosidase [Nonomuraea soli]|uniref:Beta-galactosidase n=1 Tax=Nonomuraea soli TaxID=1032476 RepID=A0A7W0HPT6_9ACTN|nr:beta-galactosidase [Nonomuraea soli]MBA2890921.1 beta-galactosidase [Nonomuraea soli]